MNVQQSLLLTKCKVSILLAGEVLYQTDLKKDEVTMMIESHFKIEIKLEEILVWIHILCGSFA